MAGDTLRDLLESELRDLYGAEQQIIAALPELTTAAASGELRTALEKHLHRTRIHVERLDFLFNKYGFAAGAAESSGIDGIIRTGAARVRRCDDRDVRDAAIISAAQHVEHYEIAGYGCARTYARQLGDDHAADLLQQTLDEEGAADKELTTLAEAGINEAASAPPPGLPEESPAVIRGQARLRFVDLNDLPAAEYRDVKIRNRAGDDLGQIDGFIIDASGRPYYLVIDTGGLFVGRRYVVPIGRADMRRGEGLLTIDLDKDALKRYPAFHREEFVAMDENEARRYEWRVLEAIDPDAARSAGSEWTYDRFPYYGQPDWFDPNAAATAPGRSRSAGERKRSGRREVPITTPAEEGDRELVVGREDSGEFDPDSRERTRGRSDEVE
jgi:ferritin-like metal-binding protein YciE